MTPEEVYERRVENTRQALSNAWDEGYRAGQSELTYDPLNYSPAVNPYRKEEEE